MYSSMEERERIKKNFVIDYDNIKDYKNHYGVIYSITYNNTIIYIGATSNYNKRIMDYIKASAKLPSNKSRDIEKAIYNVGISKFKMRVIDTGESSIELKEKEQFFIIKYNTMYPNGLNTISSGYTSDDDRIKKSTKKTGILADSDSKRKRSRPIIAVDNINKIIIYCDSAKLFGEVIIDTTKDIVARCCRKGMRCKGWFLFHRDLESNECDHKDKMNTTGYNNEIYNELYTLLKNNDDLELTKRGWVVFNLNYADNDNKYLITHLWSTIPPQSDITTTDVEYIKNYIKTPYDRSKDFGARRPFGFKVGYSYNVKHGNMCKYPANNSIPTE